MPSPSKQLIEHLGEKKTLTEWCRQYGLPVRIAINRRSSGWPMDRVLLTPYKAKFGVGPCVRASALHGASTLRAQREAEKRERLQREIAAIQSPVRVRTTKQLQKLRAEIQNRIKVAIPSTWYAL